MSAHDVMAREKLFAWKLNRHPCPRRAIKIGPLRLLLWERDKPEWYLRRGRLYLLVASFGQWELLFWDREIV